MPPLHLLNGNILLSVAWLKSSGPLSNNESNYMSAVEEAEGQSCKFIDQI